MCDQPCSQERLEAHGIACSSAIGLARSRPSSGEVSRVLQGRPSHSSDERGASRFVNMVTAFETFERPTRPPKALSSVDEGGGQPSLLIF